MKAIVMLNQIGRFGGGECLLNDLLKYLKTQITVVYTEKCETDLFPCLHVNDVTEDMIKQHHVVMYWTGGLGKYLPKFKSLPIVCMAHSEHNVDWFFTDSIRYAGYILAVCNAAKKKIEEKTDLPCHVIHTGVDFNRIDNSPAKTRKELGFSETDFVVGQFVRIIPVKRIEFAIEAISKTNAKFLLIGNGNQEQEILSLCEKKLKGRYVHIPFVKPNHVGTYYKLVDATVLSSSGEGCPLTMWESFYFSKPFISTPAGAVKQFIRNGINGYIVNNEAEMAEKINLLQRDKALFDKVSRRAKQTAELGDIKNVARLLDEYLNVVAGFPDENAERKVHFISSEIENFGHQDGWTLPSMAMENTLQKYGVTFFSWVDRELFFRPIHSKWTGFIHGIVNFPKNMPMNWTYSAGVLHEQNSFIQSKQNCCGLFTLSNHVASHLRKNLNIPVDVIYHPMREMPVKFNMEDYRESRKVTMIGQEARNYATFDDLKAPGKKKRYQSCAEWHKSKVANSVKGAEIIGRLSDEDYNDLFRDSIVFLDLYDVNACNTILESISANTPLLVRKLPAAVEYLGEDYPFFFDTLEEAESKLANDELVLKTHEYLKKADKSRFSVSRFIHDLVNSSVFKSLPKLPPKPLLRWTVGRTTSLGYEVLMKSCESVMKYLGRDTFDYVLCYNKIPRHELYPVNNFFHKLPAPIKLVRQKECDLPIPHRIDSSHNSTTNHLQSSGTFWKICPARLRTDAHEIMMDNDIVFFNPMEELEEFLKSNKTLVLEDSSIFLGKYEHLFDFRNERALNSGFMGMPPGMDFGKEIYEMWEKNGKHENLVGPDEQGLFTAVLKSHDHIMVKRHRIVGLHKAAMCLDAFNDGLPAYTVQKDRKLRRFISYEDADMTPIIKRCCALHFLNLNWMGEGHSGWDAVWKSRKVLM